MYCFRMFFSALAIIEARYTGWLYCRVCVLLLKSNTTYKFRFAEERRMTNELFEMALNAPLPKLML